MPPSTDQFMEDQDPFNTARPPGPKKPEHLAWLGQSFQTPDYNARQKKAASPFLAGWQSCVESKKSLIELESREHLFQPKPSELTDHLRSSGLFIFNSFHLSLSEVFVSRDILIITVYLKKKLVTQTLKNRNTFSKNLGH